MTGFVIRDHWPVFLKDAVRARNHWRSHGHCALCGADRSRGDTEHLRFYCPALEDTVWSAIHEDDRLSGELDRLEAEIMERVRESGDAA